MANEAQNAKPVLKKMLVEIPANAALTASKKVPGAFSPLVHGPDGVASQAVLHEMPSKMAKFAKSGFAEVLLDLAVAAAVAGGEAAIKKGIPKIRQYLAARRVVAAEESSVGGEQAGGVALAERNLAVTCAPRDDVVYVPASLTSDEWYQLFFDAVAHGVASHLHQEISAAEWGQLAGARIEDDAATQELANAMRELSPKEVSAGVARVLKERPELRDKDPLLVLQQLIEDETRKAKRFPALDKGEEGDRS